MRNVQCVMKNQKKLFEALITHYAFHIEHDWRL